MPALSDELRQKILAYLPRYPSKQAVTLPALHLVHDALRCVPFEAIREIADLLDLSPAQVHDTMTFYEFFRAEDAPLAQTLLSRKRGREPSMVEPVLLKRINAKASPWLDGYRADGGYGAFEKALT